MRRYCVMVVAWACVLGLVSCGVKPPKEAKARELVEAHFKEKGYEVECVSLGAYRLLGEGHWASEVAIKKKEADLSLLFEVEFKSTLKGYELKCGFEYMLELNDLVKKEVNEIVDKKQFSIRSIGEVPQKGEKAVNKDVPKSLSVEVLVKYLLFDPSRVLEGDSTVQPRREATIKAVLIPEINKLRTDFKNNTFLLAVLEDSIREQIILQVEDQLYCKIEVTSFSALNDNGKGGYSGKAKVSQKAKKRIGTLPFDLVLVENGQCKVNARVDDIVEWMEDPGMSAKWRGRRLEIMRKACEIARDPEKFHDEAYYPIGGDLIFIANNAITNKMVSTFWGDYTKLVAKEDPIYMTKILNTQSISSGDKSVTKMVLGNEHGKVVNVKSLPPLPVMFDSSSLEKPGKIEMEEWETEIATDIEMELAEKYDLRFMKDPDYLEKDYPIYKELDRVTVMVKEERNVKNVKVSGMIKTIGQNKIIIGPRTILISDLVDDSRLSFDMVFREKVFKERKFADAMLLKTINALRTPMHDRRMCIKLQEAGYIPNVFKREAGLYNANPKTWVSQYDFLVYWLRAHLIAKDLLEKEGYVYRLNIKLRLEWMPEKVAENMAVFIKVKYQRLLRLREVMRQQEAERERLRRDGYSEEEIERAFKEKYGDTDLGSYGRCICCKGTGKEIQYTGGGYYKVIECRFCFGTGKSSNVDGFTMDEHGNIVEDGLEYEDEEFWNSGDLVPVELK